MTDEELVSLCEKMKPNVRGALLDICMEVLDRYAAKSLASKPAKSRDMAKYMREVYRPRVKARKSQAPLFPSRKAEVIAAVISAPDKQAKPGSRRDTLEALHKMLGSNLVDPRKIAPEEDDIDFG